MKIRRKIILAFLLIFAITYIAYDFFLVSNYKKEILEDLNTHLIGDLKQFEHYLDDHAENLKRDLELVSMHYDRAKDIKDVERIADYFDTFIKSKTNSKYIYLGTRDGEFIYNSQLGVENDLSEYDPRSRLWYEDAIESPDEVIITVPYEAIDEKSYYITFAKAIIDENSNILGVVAIDMNIEEIEEYIKEVFEEDNWHIGIIINDMKIETDDKKNLIWKINEEKSKEVISNYSDNKFEKIEILDEKYYLVKRSSNNLNWIFYINVTVDYLQKMQAERARPFWILSAVVLILLISMMIIIVQKLFLKPILKMNKTVQDIINTGELEHRLNLDRKDEIGELADSFNKMLSELSIKKEHLELEISDRTEQLTKLKVAVEQSPTGIVITDLEGNITYVNFTMCSLTGYSEEELLGQNTNIFKTSYHEHEYYEDLWKLIRSGEIWNGEFYNRKKDESCYWEKCIIAPVINEQRNIINYIAMKEDVTELKAAQEKLVKAKIEAERATQAKSDFLANMSHEIRTPMNAIIGLNGLILNSDITIKQRNYSEKIDKASKHLLKIINDVLDFSKMEAGKLTIEKIEFDLREVLGNIDSIIRLQALNKNIELRFEIDPNCTTKLLGDELRLNQILINLVGNAVKFTDEGSVKLRVVCLKEDEEKAYFLFDLIDTGIGISEEEQDNIFEKFTQADESINRKYGGTGLGLVIVKNLIELMDGRFKIESKIGEGTRFKIFINFEKSTIMDNDKARNDYSKLKIVNKNEQQNLYEVDMKNIDKNISARQNSTEVGGKNKIKIKQMHKDLMICLENNDTDAEDYVIKLIDMSKEHKKIYQRAYNLILDYEFEKAIEILSQI